MIANNDYGIITKADKHFFPGVKALLKSLAVHAPKIPVTVLDCGMTEEQHSFCLKIANSVQKVDLSEFTINQPKYTTSVYSFFVADLNHYRITLHLDADTIVLGNLDDIFIAAEQHGLAATTDYPPLSLNSQIQNEDVFQKTCKIIPDLDRNSIAFNAGVFAVSYDYWQTKMVDKISDLLPLHPEFWGNDQAILNLAAFAVNPSEPFRNVGLKFNSRPFYRRSPSTLPPQLCENDTGFILKGIDGPIHVLHFIGQPKPWQEDYSHSCNCLKVWNYFYSK
jgi:lipopolysaccharide biosynthesis glycosyltransferase